MYALFAHFEIFENPKPNKNVGKADDNKRDLKYSQIWTWIPYERALHERDTFI